MPPFDRSAPHMERPRLRQVRGFPAQAGEQQVLGLADARQITDKMVFVAPAVEAVLPHMDGSKSLDEIAAAIGRGLKREFLENLVAQLDEAGLLYGPRFDSLLATMRADFDSAPNLPPASTAAVADFLVMSELGENASEAQRAELGPAKLSAAMDQWMDAALKEADSPSFDTLPKAIVAPHIDYNRGWLNYASVYGRLRVVDRPDRVVVLGTNHFGEATGACACDKGFSTPLGTCEVDRELAEALRRAIGPAHAQALFANRYDHEREHSIELQIPWIQHCLGRGDDGNFCKVLGILVHDPCVNNGESYDGQGVGLTPFVEAMRAAIASLPGRTLIVASADLSHVGPTFGDALALAGDEQEAAEARNKVFHHDREMLQMFSQGRLDEMVAAMAWQRNPTRWCSLGNMVAAYRIVGAQSAQLLNYAGAMDEHGHGLVTNVSMVMN